MGRVRKNLCRMVVTAKVVVSRDVFHVDRNQCRQNLVVGFYDVFISFKQRNRIRYVFKLY